MFVALTLINMTDQVKLFLDKYFETLHGTQSAIFAGYSAHTARVKASQILATDEAEEYLNKQREKAQKRTNITVDRVLNEYAKIAFFDVRQVFGNDGELLPIHQIDDSTAGAINSIESIEEWGEDDNGDRVVIGTLKKVKVTDKVRALDSLSKHLGIFEKDNSQKGKMDITWHEEKVYKDPAADATDV